MSKIKLYFNSYKSFAYILLYYFIAMAIRYYFVVVKPDFFSTTNNYFQSLLLGVSPLVSGLILVYFFKRKNDLSLFSIGLQKTILIIILPVILFTIVGFLNTNSFNSQLHLVFVHLFSMQFLKNMDGEATCKQSLKW